VIELTDQDRRAMFAELREISGVAVPIEGHQFTIRQFAEAEDIPYDTAGRALAKLHKNGVLHREKRLVGDSLAWAYWRKDAPAA